MGIRGYETKPGAPCTTGSSARFAFARVVTPALSLRSRAVMRMPLAMALVGDNQSLLACDAQKRDVQPRTPIRIDKEEAGLLAISEALQGLQVEDLTLI